MNPLTLYTLGHSNREPEAFLQLLVDADIRQLVDIRTVPRSRRFPHFDAEALRQLVEPHGITYHLTGKVFGGLRHSDPMSPHHALGEELRGFADHMMSETFGKAVEQLVRLAEQSGPVALLCAERLPAHCHRRLLADYLHARGVSVVHLIDAQTACVHTLSLECRLDPRGLVYDRAVETAPKPH